eukprot:350227-Chlamydomonas_euryale.AAC.2
MMSAVVQKERASVQVRQPGRNTPPHQAVGCLPAVRASHLQLSPPATRLARTPSTYVLCPAAAASTLVMDAGQPHAGPTHHTDPACA